MEPISLYHTEAVCRTYTEDTYHSYVMDGFSRVTSLVLYVLATVLAQAICVSAGMSPTGYHSIITCHLIN